MFDDMKVTNYRYILGGEGSDLESDWDLLAKYALFKHSHAGEFILYIGSLASLESLKDEGFSFALREVCFEAARAGYQYICLYA